MTYYILYILEESDSPSSANKKAKLVIIKVVNDPELRSFHK